MSNELYCSETRHALRFDDRSGRGDGYMKLGLISDIHSNFRAFKACIDYFEKECVDYYLLLGDYVSDTAYPEKVMRLLYELRENHKCVIIRGNREDYFIDNEERPAGWRTGSASGNLLYTREHLTDADIDFFTSLPIADSLRLDGYPTITVCHGSPVSTREHIYPNIYQGYNSMAKTARAYGECHSAETGTPFCSLQESKDVDGWLQAIDTDILVSGHTHHRCIYSHEGRTYVNLGSCGIAIGNSGVAECALFTGVEANSEGTLPYAWDIQLLSIPYDVEETIRDIYDSGLYDMGHWFLNANIQTLSTGIDHASDLVIRSNGLDFAAKKHHTWPDISEGCFAQAAGELRIPDYTPGKSLTYVRMATPDDAERLREIYAPYVTDTAITFEYDVPSVAEFRNRICSKLEKYPYFVAVRDGKILGYAYASEFRTRAAYSKDVELSIYVDREYRGGGIGSILIECLEEMLKRRGFINLYSVITGSGDPNDPYITDGSLRFHRKHGYMEEGCLKKCGTKFSRWYDIHFFNKKFII